MRKHKIGKWALFAALAGKHGSGYAAVVTGVTGAVVTIRSEDPWVWALSVLGVVVVQSYFPSDEGGKLRALANGVISVVAGAFIGPFIIGILNELIIINGFSNQLKDPAGAFIISAAWPFIVFKFIPLLIPEVIKVAFSKSKGG